MFSFVCKYVKCVYIYIYLFIHTVGYICIYIAYTYKFIVYVINNTCVIMFIYNTQYVFDSFCIYLQLSLYLYTRWHSQMLFMFFFPMCNWNNWRSQKVRFSDLLRTHHCKVPVVFWKKFKIKITWRYVELTAELLWKYI